MEAALQLLHMLGETAGLSAPQLQSGSDVDKAVQVLLHVMLNTDVHLHTHSTVVLQYFETVVR